MRVIAILIGCGSIAVALTFLELNPRAHAVEEVRSDAIETRPMVEHEAPESLDQAPQEDVPHKVVEPPLQIPSAMKERVVRGPVGQGLEAWQKFYLEAPKHVAGVLDSGSPEFVWWYTDPEILALFEAEYEKQLLLMEEEFRIRRERENDPEQFDSGSQAFLRNLDRFQGPIEGLGFDPEWFRVQEPRSDVARHLSNYLVMQTRYAESGKDAAMDNRPRYRFNAPLEQVVRQACGKEVYELSHEAQQSAVDAYANALMAAAELRSRQQVIDAAHLQAAMAMRIPALHYANLEAPFSAAYLDFENQLAGIWDEFVAELAQ